MSTSGQPGGIYRIPATRKSNALSTPQNPCDHWKMNGECRFGAKCKHRRAEGDEDIQDGSDSISSNVSAAEIKRQAKESISKEVRGRSAFTLIRTARTKFLSAQDQEAKGDLAMAYSSYIEAATLVKLTMDSPEYNQDAKDMGTAIRVELGEFLQNEGRDISRRAIAVEEKLKAIEIVYTAESEVIALSSNSVPNPLQLRATINETSTHRSDMSVICTYWQRDGSCRYGQRCRFGHAIQENEERRSRAKDEENQRKEKADREKEEGDRAEREWMERERENEEKAEREVWERREADARRRDEAVQQRNEARRVRLEAERKREREVEHARLRESLRSAREQAAKEEQKAREEAKKKREQEIEQARLARENAAREAAIQREHQEQMKIRREKEAAVIEQYIVSESSLITCSAGMNIQRIVCGFELCRITIKNLPNDAKLDEIADIFTQQGIDSSEFFILHLKPNGGKCEAVVLASVDQGQYIAARLEDKEFGNRSLTLEVSENASWNGMSTTAQNATFLTVSWAAPSETIVATYDSLEQARNQAQRLNGKTWNGCRIRVTLDDRTTWYIAPEIEIRGCVPGTAFTPEFYAFVETFDIKLLSAANHNLNEVFTDVREHLRYFPGVRMHTYEVLNNGNQLDAEAWIKVEFDDWEDAKRAHDTIDRKRLRSNFPLLRSWLPKPLQYSIKIPRQQYQAQKTQWDELSKKKLDHDAHVHTTVGDRDDVFIRVLGQDKKAVGSLKVRVEGMVAGEKLDAAHWHTSFAFPRGKLFFTRILDKKEVYVRNDFKAHCLRVCGEPARVEEAKQMIRKEVERLARTETTRVLDAACIRGFMREGLGKLKELIGEDNVVVNVASLPYKVTVKGGIEAVHHLQRLINESRAMGAIIDTPPRNAKREICPICTDNVSNTEQLGCGHTYCSGCLSHFLTSTADSKSFPLVCMGNGGQCRVPMAIPFIRQFLPHQLFKNLVEATFIAYLEQHPQELKYCTTPDCKQIYRRRTDKTLLKCPACFATICPMCDEEAHEGMTCEERKIHLDPGLHERLNDELAREQGYKKCPQCNIFIEKAEGSNHMMCKCGAHICWICLRLFTASTIYQHIGIVHQGRLYDAVPADVNQGNVEVDKNALMAAQIREIESFESERRAFEAMRVPERVPQPNPAPPVGTRPLVLVQNVVRVQAAQHKEEETREAQWSKVRAKALRIEQEIRAREELQIRENQERIARLQAAQTAPATLDRMSEEERRRREEGGWCIVM